MLKCKVCECSFTPIVDKHYIARDNGESGFATAFKSQEGKIYDAFDCPACGCQIVAQERKRGFVSTVSNGYPDEVVFVEKESEEDDNA